MRMDHGCHHDVDTMPPLAVEYAARLHGLISFPFEWNTRPNAVCKWISHIKSHSRTYASRSFVLCVRMALMLNAPDQRTRAAPDGSGSRLVSVSTWYCVQLSSRAAMIEYMYVASNFGEVTKRERFFVCFKSKVARMSRHMNGRRLALPSNGHPLCLCVLELCTRAVHRVKFIECARIIRVRCCYCCCGF